MRARNRELLALVPASLLLTAGFAAVFVQRNDLVTNLSLTYGAIFLGLCVAGHLVIRFTLPDADPYLFPLAATLACFGLVMIYRINQDLAREQAQWFVVGLVLFAATIIVVRDISVLERYRYVIATAGILLLVLPRLPGIGAQVNGAYLGVKLGPITFQPAEFAKIAIVIFLASYLRDTRQLLVSAGRRIGPLTLPPLKHLGPLLVVWGLAMLLLVFIRDLGSSLMFFGAFLALVYVATDRFSFVAIGLALFGVGAWFFSSTVGHVQDRIDAWQHPFDQALYDKIGGSYQVAQGLFAQADGGLLGKGFGESILDLPGTTAQLVPAAHTDLIYAVIVNELGLVGAVGVLLVYLLIVERAMKTSIMARDSFSKLLAAGLGAVFGLQVFVIVGGVTKVIPLTGVTLPFISYGGSSILANFVLLALLLLVSDKARRGGWERSR
jgi:cell division protein FtsW (lipid II flippase)